MIRYALCCLVVGLFAGCLLDVDTDSETAAATVSDNDGGPPVSNIGGDCSPDEGERPGGCSGEGGGGGNCIPGTPGCHGPVQEPPIFGSPEWCALNPWVVPCCNPLSPRCGRQVFRPEVPEAVNAFGGEDNITD